MYVESVGKAGVLMCEKGLAYFESLMGPKGGRTWVFILAFSGMQHKQKREG